MRVATSFMKTKQPWTATFHIFVLISTVIAILMFLYGFFPLKNYTGSSLDKDHAPVLSYNGSTGASAGRLVFMVIDALRSDFITGPECKANMPYLSHLISTGAACVHTAIANPPTVTMPRIKAMVTGTVPGFVDVVFNLGSSHVVEDSFISNLVSSGRKAVFFGDDTWLKLFPNMFSRSEGTTSFFVADYTEVDRNVTRHLSTELSREDWSLMVLHYLGLDHIGHLVGPRSPLVGPKLSEMDAIIQQIHQAAPQSGQLLIVCGDHGMKDSGSHGGASEAETHVAVVSLGLPCHSSPQSISQVDLAPTLSLLLGLPNPADSIGMLIPGMLDSLSVEHQLAAWRQNAVHLSSQLGSSISSKQEILCEEAHSLYSEWQSTPSDHLLAERVQSLYSSCCADMSASLAKTHTNFDLYALAVAMALVIQSLVVLFVSTLHSWRHSGSKSSLFLTAVFFIGVNALICSSPNNSTSIMCSLQPQGLIIQVVFISTLTYFVRLCYLNVNKLKIKLPEILVDKFLLLGTFLHCFGLGASSLVEEEHQVWYFLWTSLLILLITRESWKMCVINLVIHRVAKKWNQTGDKWAALPDVRLYLSERRDLTTSVFVLGLVFIGLYLLKDKNKKKRVKLLQVVMLLLIFLYRAAIGSVNFFYHSHLSNQGWIEARLFGFCLLVSLLLQVVNDKASIPTAIKDCWLLGVTILRRPHDVLLLPVLLQASYFLTSALHTLTFPLVTSHIWLGSVNYFYQGNSNSLASVDVAAGYVGLTDYQPVLVGLFLMAHTYSAPVLSQFLLLETLLKNKELHEVLRGLRLVSILRLLPMCVYLVVVSLQREHLFVWTVFAPKLLYEAMAALVSLLTLLVCHTIIKIIKV